MSLNDLPAFNAFFNGMAAVFLTAGFVLIRQKNRAAHQKCMIAALGSSALFLCGYLTYHFVVHGLTKFQNPAWFRPIYLTLLLTHTVLAVVIVPLIAITLTRALRERFDAHRRIARWTWPLWMYVSVTGVVIYWLLYIKFPQG
jgi:putative membrane protein